MNPYESWFVNATRRYFMIFHLVHDIYYTTIQVSFCPSRHQPFPGRVFACKRLGTGNQYAVKAPALHRNFPRRSCSAATGGEYQSHLSQGAHGAQFEAAVLVKQPADRTLRKKRLVFGFDVLNFFPPGVKLV